MKQTVEEAADECRIAIALSLDKSCFDIDECQDAGLSYDELVYNSFITGAKWQAKQSPWISVEDKAGCDTSGDCIVMVMNGDIFKAYFSSEKQMDEK